MVQLDRSDHRSAVGELFFISDDPSSGLDLRPELYAHSMAGLPFDHAHNDHPHGYK